MESDVQPSGSASRTSTTSAEHNYFSDDPLENIIEGCRKRDVKYQERLYKRYYGYAMSAALAYSSSREDAVEVVNDSFLKVFDNIDRFKSNETFKPWLRRIVINTAIDQARKMKRFDQKADLDVERMEQSESVTIESKLNEKQIYELLNRLPDLLRFVFNMYEVEGYSHREIADRLSIAESSSRTYLTRAKTRLRELYKKRFADDI